MKKRRVLVVEDDKAAASALAYHLAGLGHCVLGPAATGEDAVALAKSDGPDLILMDLILAGHIDGIEAAWRLRAFSAADLVLMSALPLAVIESRSMGLRPAAILHKPFGLDDLDGVLGNI